MDNNTIEVVKQVMTYAVGPLMGLFAWVGKKMHTEVETNKRDINDLKISHAVQGSQLKDLKEDVHQINKKLDKILDRVSK